MKNNNLYTEAQKCAIMHGDGPGIVFAGPGSGKTFVLTEHIFYMIYTLGIKPEHILVITFTKAAALQMKARFYQKSKEQLPITFKTFHAFFYQILSWDKTYSSKKILSNQEKIQIIKQIIYRYFSNESDQEELMKEISACISNRYMDTKNRNIYLYFTRDEEKKIVSYYEEEKGRMKRVDFVDLIYQCLGKIKHDSEFLNKIQRQFSYILIDEFQDITPPQYEIINLIVKKSKNIFVVGDEDQSIYKFCGSKAECMQDFMIDYPNSKIYFLDINFRSKKEIIRYGQNLIRHNPNRIDKDVSAFTEGSGDIIYEGFPSKELEYSYLADQIKKECIKYSGEKIKIGIITRTKFDWNQITLYLLKKEISISNINKKKQYLKSEYMEDIISYLKFAYMGNKRSDLVRILNKPIRYLSIKYFRDEVVSFNDIKEEFKNQTKIRHEICKLENQMQFIKHMTLHAAIHFIRKGIGYDQYAKESMINKKENYILIFKELDHLLDLSKYCDSVNDLEESIKSVNMTDVETNMKNNNYLTTELRTMHAAKGLEYDMVFILDANEGVIPHVKATKEESIEEERRLFYVAITRAKRDLYILFVSNRNKGQIKSRYIDECIGKTKC